MSTEYCFKQNLNENIKVEEKNEFVLQKYQRRQRKGYCTAVVLGHKEYYPRFGYRKAIDLGIEFPFEVSHECWYYTACTNLYPY